MLHRVRLIGVALTVGCLWTSASEAEDRVWVGEENFAQLNVACIRVYVCRPGQDILHSADTVLKLSEPQTQTGICSAGDGPIDGCNVCVSNPPSDPCTWELVPK